LGCDGEAKRGVVADDEEDDAVDGDPYNGPILLLPCGAVVIVGIRRERGCGDRCWKASLPFPLTLTTISRPCCLIQLVQEELWKSKRGTRSVEEKTR
jgi:hypothetical protein